MKEGNGEYSIDEFEKLIRERISATQITDLHRTCNSETYQAKPSDFYDPIKYKAEVDQIYFENNKSFSFNMEWISVLSSMLSSVI